MKESANIIAAVNQSKFQLLILDEGGERRGEEGRDRIRDSGGHTAEGHPGLVSSAAQHKHINTLQAIYRRNNS